MSGKSKCIILPNGMKVQADILEGKTQKKQNTEESSHRVLKDIESLGKEKFRVVAESKPSTELPNQ